MRCGRGTTLPSGATSRRLYPCSSPWALQGYRLLGQMSEGSLRTQIQNCWFDGTRCVYELLILLPVSLWLHVPSQAGAFYPFFRAHAHVDTRRREPWLYDSDEMALMRNALRMRYELLPFWYTVFYETSKTGLPVVRWGGGRVGRWEGRWEGGEERRVRE